MRSKRSQQRDERAQGFTHDGAIHFTGRFRTADLTVEISDGIEQFHQFGDRRVQLEISFEVLRDAANRLMRLSHERPLGGSELFSRHGGGIRDDRPPPPHHRVQPAEEAKSPLDAFLLPLQLGVGRCGKEDENAQRIRTIFGDHVVRINAIAERFGHRQPPPGIRAAGDDVEHHALGEKPRHRFGDVNQSQIPHELAPEARVKQVHDGVLHSADILIHREPIADDVGIKRGTVVSRIAVAEIVPAGINERIHRVGVTSGSASA